MTKLKRVPSQHFLNMKFTTGLEHRDVKEWTLTDFETPAQEGQTGEVYGVRVHQLFRENQTILRF